jgi:response regulator RpfG family c-di-GMP phosphodiesterase
MKYKLLLVGTNVAAIDDFFRKMESYFELMTTSFHYNDIKSHLKYYQPDAIVYCMHKESRQTITNVMSLKQQTIGANVPFVIIGDPEDCEVCCKIAVNAVDCTLVKPLTANVIRDQLMEFLDRIRLQEKKQEKEAAAAAAADAETEPEEGETEDVLNAENDLLADILSSVMPTGTPETDNEQPYTYHPKKQKDVAYGDKLHILVVDDDVRMIKTLKLFLEEEYQVATAVSGTIAMRYLETKPADLILLDYEMPDMSGPEVLEQIHSHPGLSEIPVIFLTGASERAKIAKALAMKPQGYLLKPVERVALMSKLHEILG